MKADKEFLTKLTILAAAVAVAACCASCVSTVHPDGSRTTQLDREALSPFWSLARDYALSRALSQPSVTK